MPTPTKGTRLGGSPAHERLMLANLATSLFEHGRITTTEAKARRLRPLAEKLIARAVKAIGTAVASAINLIDVEAVIIGGGLGVRFGQPYADKIAKEMHKHLFVDERPPATLVAELGDLGGAIGASLLFDE